MSRRSRQAIAALLAVFAMDLSAVCAAAQSPDAVAAARRVFAQGVADEDATRYEVALDEFQQVAKVKETSNVRYRIASCLDALGRLAEALRSYNLAIGLGATDPAAEDTVHAARARAAQLDALVPQLTLVLPTPWPPELRVLIDEVPVDPDALVRPLLLDAGHHSIAATAAGASAFRTSMTFPEGSRASIAIELPPLARGADPSERDEPTHAPAPERRRSGDSTAATYLALGAGAVLGAGAIVSLVLRASNLATLHRDCGAEIDGRLSCPRSEAANVNAAQDAAQVDGPLAIALGAGSAVGVGLAVWWALRGASRESAAPVSRGLRVTPVFGGHEGAIVVDGAL
jgi:tetratricopeptide (TPR) repeat protein